NDLPEQNVDVDTFVLTGTASSGLDLTFESSDDEIVSIIGNIATVHKDGVVSITGHQPGNQNYLAADDVVRSQVVNVVLGIEPFDLSKHIYPNPTRDFVFLQIPEVESVEVLDVVGRIRKDVVWVDGKIDFSRTESGLYFVRILFQNRTEVSRIIKN
ncbi:MAG TPA: T9SS type A sorting domain-containing protein, partial [Chryseolinea sp.]|nr:T9SS type A sorting domain-containing protein [Chryseolinea sp.]